MGIGIMVWFLFAVVSSLDQLVISVNLRAGPVAALFIVLLDPIETARELTVYGAGLGAGRVQHRQPGGHSCLGACQRVPVHLLVRGGLDSGHLRHRIPRLQAPRRRLVDSTTRGLVDSTGRDSLLPAFGTEGTTSLADRLDQKTPVRRDRAAGRRELPIHILVGACGEGHDQPTEEREKAPACARGGKPEEKRPSPALRVQGRTGHPRERKDRDGRVEEEPEAEEQQEREA